ncbi:MAG: hypothetical protein SGILL_008454 [Bacillariaceae sp.]
MTKFWASADDASSSIEDSKSRPLPEEAARDDVFDNQPSVYGHDDDNSDAGQDEMELSKDPDWAWETIQDAQVFQDVVPVTATKADNNCTRLVIFSDTHGLHRKVHLPRGDILIHAGDFSKTGEVKTIEDLSEYFAESGFQKIVVIAGNHDMTLDREYYQRRGDKIHRNPMNCDQAQAAIERNATYLNDSSWTSDDGLTFYGSPYSPYFFGWAFNLHRGEPIKECWDKIPSHEEWPVDILMTHGPPLGRGDLTAERRRAGCYDLLKAVQQRVKPRVHIFGHIHEGYGTSFDGHTLYINASSLNVQYQPVNRPIVVDIDPHDKSAPPRIVEPVNDKVNSKDELETFCRDHGFNDVAAALASCGNAKLPLGNDLLRHSSAYYKLMDALNGHRLQSVRNQLDDVLGKIYTESFE